jgi:hypothetical protein
MIDLDEATRALREESDGSSLGAPHTRARIMRSLHEGKHERRLRWGFGIPLAVVFAGSTAFAGARGDLGETVESAFTSVRSLFTPAESAPPSATPGPRGQGPSAAVPAPTEPAPEAAPPNAPTEPTPPESDLTPNAPHAPSAAPAPSLEDPATTAALRMYRAAHEAQFQNADCAAALASYDAYLKAAPKDRLVPEARYNRALCLVTLGQKDAARKALTPFAEGTYGGFRKRESKALLEALGSD